MIANPRLATFTAEGEPKPEPSLSFSRERIPATAKAYPGDAHKGLTFETPEYTRLTLATRSSQDAADDGGRSV